MNMFAFRVIYIHCYCTDLRYCLCPSQDVFLLGDGHLLCTLWNGELSSHTCHIAISPAPNDITLLGFEQEVKERSSITHVSPTHDSWHTIYKANSIIALKAMYASMRSHSGFQVISGRRNHSLAPLTERHIYLRAILLWKTLIPVFPVDPQTTSRVPHM